MRSILILVLIGTALVLSGCGGGSTTTTTKAPAGTTFAAEATTTSAAAAASDIPGYPGYRVTQVTLGAYPGYTGALKVTGTVTLTRNYYDAGEVDLTWAIHGLQTTECAAAPPSGVANACGIHIHIGKSCTDAKVVGGHYYNETMKSDPWSPAVYRAWRRMTHGSSRGKTSVVIDEAFDSIQGRAFVVHDSAGARVGCGLITKEAIASALSRAPVEMV